MKNIKHEQNGNFKGFNLEAKKKKNNKYIFNAYSFIKHIMMKTYKQIQS